MYNVNGIFCTSICIGLGLKSFLLFDLDKASLIHSINYL